jgi:hypothetical protein
MIQPRRLLALAAALNLTVCAGAATAQTLLVRNAPPGTTIELVLNTTTIGSKKLDNGGTDTVPGNFFANDSRDQIDALIFLDTCDSTRKLVVVDRALSPPPPDAGCIRRDMGGVFVVKKISTFVIDLGAPSTLMMLRQGPVSLKPPRQWTSPTGLVLFGGAGLSRFSDARDIACGDASTCSKNTFDFAFTTGIDYWVFPYLAAEVTYIKPGNVDVNGSGTGFHFDSTLKTDVVTVGAKAGVPVRGARIYGQGGFNYTKSATESTEVTDPKTITVDGVSQTIPGGTIDYKLSTEGWGWQFGGGVEGWIKPHVGLYGELQILKLKGTPIVNVDGDFSDTLLTFMFGVRVHIGK